METLRLSHLEAINCFVLEYRAIARDQSRYNSEEWYENQNKRNAVISHIKEFGKQFGIDYKVLVAQVEAQIGRIPAEMYGRERLLPESQTALPLPFETPAPAEIALPLEEPILHSKLAA